MLSENAFEAWCQKLALSEQAKASLSQIRSSPPSRLVRSAAGNVSGRYPSCFQESKDEPKVTNRPAQSVNHKIQ